MAEDKTKKDVLKIVAKDSKKVNLNKEAVPPVEIEEEEISPKKTKHFYVALGLCMVAIGAAALSTYQSVRDYRNIDDPGADYNYSLNEQQDGNMWAEDNTVGQNKNNAALPGLEEVPAQAKVEQKNKVSENKKLKRVSQENFEYDNEDSTAMETMAGSSVSGSSLVIYPVGKEVIKGYSGDNLAYNTTFKDWRAHLGVDYKATQGQEVKSIAKGIVKNIYEDQKLGKTIEIEHDGYTSYLSGLANMALVKVGQKVEAGTKLGAVNDIPSEKADGYHIHLAIKKDGKYIDPGEIVKD